MGDIIDTVNENLLRIAAEKQKCSENSDKKWRKDFYYFVVDTNVFLTDLTFIEDLTKMQLSGKLCNQLQLLQLQPIKIYIFKLQIPKEACCMCLTQCCRNWINLKCFPSPRKALKL